MKRFAVNSYGLHTTNIAEMHFAANEFCVGMDIPVFHIKNKPARFDQNAALPASR